MEQLHFHKQDRGLSVGGLNYIDKIYFKSNPTVIFIITSQNK